MSKIQRTLETVLVPFMQGTQETFGIHLDYSPLSLMVLEQELDKRYVEGEQRETAMTVCVGLYLGEMLVRNLKGRWEEPASNQIFGLAVKIDGKDGMSATAHPLVRVDKFWKDRTDGLYVYYQGIESTAKKSIAEIQGSYGQWEHKGPNSKFRTIPVEDMTPARAKEMGISWDVIQKMKAQMGK